MERNGSIYTALYRHTKALALALGYRDHMTRLHSERVLGLSEAVGERLGIDRRDMGLLRVGASFHDIGKIGIPDSILMKPAGFETAEWEIMRQHAVIGEAIVAATGLEGAAQAASVIRHHHEHFDGSGYPDGIGGDEIPIHARIISIADCYDAMAETRSYHRGRSHAEILDILRGETGRKHDPDLMRVFCEIIEDSPHRAADA